MGCGASSDASATAQPVSANTTRAPTREPAAAPAPASAPATATATDGGGSREPPVAAAGSNTKASVASTALKGLATLASAAPLPGASALSTVLSHCAALILSASTRPTWLADFSRYLASVQADLEAASEVFRRDAFLTQLAAQLRSAESTLRTIVARPRWRAALYSTADEAALQAQQAACEKIKAAALTAMLTEIKADSSSTLDLARRIHEDLHALDAARQLREEEQSQKRDHERLLTRLQPLDFSVDVAAELRNFMPGTRTHIIQAVDRWLTFGGGGTGSGGKAAGAPAGNEGAGQSPPVTSASASSSASSLPSAASPPSSSRLFWIRGGPGAGKSCLSAKLVELYPDCIVALHLCRHNSADRRDARRLVKSMAFQLAERIPAYARRLREVLPAVFGMDAASLSASSTAAEQRDHKSAVDLWQQLIVAPLSAVSSELSAECSTRGRRFALLIDALDEASTSAGGKSDLLDLLASGGLDALPPWVGVVLTSRPEAVIVARLQRYRPVEIQCESAENQADLRAFLQFCVRKAHQPSANTAAGDGSAASSSASAPAVADESALIDLLLAKSGGLFLLGRMMMEQHGLLHSDSGDAASSAPMGEDADRAPRDYASSPLTAAEVASWPAGLDAFYFTCLKRVRSGIVAAGGKGAMLVSYGSSEVPADLAALLRVVAVIMASAELLTLGTLADMMELKDHLAAFRVLAPLRSLLPISTPQTDGGAAAASNKQPPAPSPLSTVAVYHKSVRDWFVSEARREEAAVDPDAVYFIDLPATHAMLAENCWSRLVDADAPDLMLDAKMDGAPANQSISSSAVSHAVSGMKLPPLVVDEVVDAIEAAAPSAEEEEGSAAHATSASSVPVFPLWSTPCSALAPSFLRYAVSRGASHALNCGDASAAASWLCHPQYVHMRGLLGQTGALSEEYLQAKQLASEAAASSKRPKRSKKDKLGSGSWMWASSLPPLDCLSQFRRLYLKHSPDWTGVPELVYQYACSFPDESYPACIGRMCLGWYRGWSRRSHTVARWVNKPGHLSDWLSQIKTGPNVTAFALHPYGACFLVGTANAELSLYHADSGERMSQWPVPRDPEGNEALTCLEFSADGSLLAAGYSGRMILIYDVASESLLHTCVAHKFKVYSASFSADGSKIVSRGKDDRSHLWDTRTGQEIRSFKVDQQHGIAFFHRAREEIFLSKPGVGFAAVDLEGRLLRDVAEGADAVALSPDGARIATFAFGLLGVRVYSTETGALLLNLGRGHLFGLEMSFSACGTWLLVGGDDSCIYAFHSHTGVLHHVFRSQSASVMNLAPSKDGTRLFARTAIDVRVYDMHAVPTQAPAVALSEAQEGFDFRNSRVNSLALTRVGDKFVTGPRLQVFDAESGTLLRAEPAVDGLFHAPIRITPDGSRILTGRRGTLQCFSLDTLEHLSGECIPDAHRAWITALDLAASGAILATGSNYLLDQSKEVEAGCVAVWSWPSRALVHRWSGHSTAVECVRFNPDATLLASADASGIVRVWSVRTGELLSTVDRSATKGNAVTSIDWHPTQAEPALLVGYSLGPTLLDLIDACSGAVLRSFSHCDHAADAHATGGTCTLASWSAVWNREGSLLLTSGRHDECLTIRDAASGAVVHRIRMHSVGRLVVWSADQRSVFVLAADLSVRRHRLPEQLRLSAPVPSSSSYLAPSPPLFSQCGFDDAGFQRFDYD